MGANLPLFADLFSLTFGYWWLILPTALLGIVVGAIPGFSAQNTLIIMLPLTLVMSLEMALIFMGTLYCAARMGAGIPAILINIPGTAGAAATVLDGYPMTVKGQAQQALVLCFVASAVGGLLTSILTLFVMPYIAQIGLTLRSVEMVAIMVLGLTLIAVIAARDLIKGLLSGFIGLLLGAIGTDNIYSAPRGTMGFLELFDGVPLIPALIGLFAISEALVMIEQKTIVSRTGRERMIRSKWADVVDGFRMAIQRWWHIIWTSLIGLVVGVVPGAGAGIASFVAYQQSRLFSKTPDLYGTGHPEGLIAPEAANNGVTSGTLVPMMTIGVPGGITAAIMLIVIQYHGVVPGPRLFVDRPEVAYGIFVAMVVAYIFIAATVLPMARAMARITLVSTSLLAPLIIAVTLAGAFVPRQYLFDIGLAVVFGVVGYVAQRTGYHVTAILIGIILGPLLEQYLLRALRISRGDVSILFSSAIGNVLWALVVVSLVLPYVLEYRRKRQARRATLEPDPEQVGSP